MNAVPFDPALVLGCSEDEAVMLLHLSPGVVRRMLDQGRLPHAACG